MLSAVNIFSLQGATPETATAMAPEEAMGEGAAVAEGEWESSVQIPIASSASPMQRELENSANSESPVTTYLLDTQTPDAEGWLGFYFQFCLCRSGNSGSLK